MSRNQSPLNVVVVVVALAVFWAVVGQRVYASVVVNAPYKVCDPLWRLLGWC